MSKTAEVRILDDAEELAREAADFFRWLGEQTIAASGRFRVALCGGSTPRALYMELARSGFSQQSDWSRAEFYFGDERYVPPDHPDSNFGMAQETLFGPLKITSERIFRMAGEAPDPDRAARQYEELLRSRFGTPPPLWPSFDLILLGLGEDAHTASLFPGTPALDEHTRLVVATTAPGGIRDRLTLTAPAINQARTILFFVSGDKKAGAVRAVLEGQSQEYRRYPAKLIRPVNGRLLWFLDRPAASSLTLAKQQVVSHEE